MPIPCCPLFAAGFDWVEVLLPFLFLAFWGISQVLAALRRLGGGPQPPARIERPRPRPAGHVRSELERQIEEFLRQSAGEQPRRPVEPPQAEPVRPVARAPVRPAAGPAAPAPRADRARLAGGANEERRAPRSLVEADAVATASTPPAVESVARHVSDAFSHDLAHSHGGFADEATAPQTVTPRSIVLSTELAGMLRSPAATRRAILLREVLDRPVDRW